MHHYQHHIGDFRAGTANWPHLMRWLYRDMLDVYYDTEQPLSASVDDICQAIGAVDQEFNVLPQDRAAVERILKLKFDLQQDGWHNKRCDAVIAAYRAIWYHTLTKAERCEIQARRNAVKKSAMPKWLSDSQLKDIANMYKQCADISNSTGIKHEVDHIIPLQSKLVCGLHVAWNLRVIKASENRSKSNKLIEV